MEIAKKLIIIDKDCGNRSDTLVVLHVAPITDFEVSGLTFAIPPSVETLHYLGIQTALLTSSSIGRYEKAEIYPVIYIKDLPPYPALESLPEPFNCPDLIVFHSTYIVSHIPIIYEAITRKIPYVIKPHGGMTAGAQQLKRLKKLIGNLCFFNWMVRNSAAIQCLTEQEALDVKIIWKHPVFIAGNGVSLPPIHTLVTPGQNQDLRFVFLGRLAIQHKGLDLLIKACNIIQDNLRQSHVQISLYGPDERGSKERLQESIDSYKIQDLIQINDPVWGEKSKQLVFQNADIFLHTSRFEGHPMAVLEALSYGIPCLLTPGTRMAENVDSAGAGWAVDSTPESIAQGIDKILDRRHEIPLRGQAARNFIEEKYTWIQVGRQSQIEYENIINKSRVVNHA